MTICTTTRTTKKAPRLSRAACLTLAVLPVAAFFPTSAFAGQGAASYIDFNGATAGFGTPGGTIAETAAIWSTSNAGTNATTAKPSGTQLTVGNTAADFAGQTFSINMDLAGSLQGVVINSGNVTLTGNSNEHNNSSPNTWTIAAGAQLWLNDTRQNFANASGNASQIKSFNWNNVAVTFTGGGTMNFLSPLGSNSSQVNTENMDSTGVINFLMPLDAGTTSTYSGGFALNTGTLNFASAGAADQFIGTGSGKFFAINGGTIDNTFTSALTLNLGTAGGQIAFGGNFNYTGTNALNTGTGAVLLNASTTINTVANTLTIDGVVSGNTATAGLGKTGAGTLVLTNNENYTGVTNVNGGKLVLANASSNNISSSSGVTIASGATLDVTGLSGGLNLSGSQTITNNGSILGGVTFSGSTALKDIISGATGTSGSLTGTATFGSNSNIVISQIAAPTLSSYTLLTATSIVGLTATGGATHLQTIGRTVYDIDATALSNNIVQIDVTGGAGNLTWVGTDGTSPTLWENAQATHNWTGTAPIGDTTEFFDGDAVTFDASGVQQSITISGTVTPGNMNVTGGTYTFGGGSIAGSGSLTVSGSGSLTISTSPNTFSGGTVINTSGTVTGNASGAFGTGPVTLTNGHLNINNNGALSTSTFTINGGFLDNTSGSAVINAAVTPIVISNGFTFQGSSDLNLGTGNVTLSFSPNINIVAGNFTIGGNITGGTNSFLKIGPGTLILGGNSNTYSGGATINVGALQVVGTGGKTGLGSGNTTVNPLGTLIGGGTDAFGFTAGSSPTTIFINGGNVTDLPGAYRITLQDIHFTGGGTLTSDPGNTGNGTQGQYSLNTGTVETDASSTQAVISAGCISLQHGNTTFNVALGSVPVSGVDLLISSSLINFNTTLGAVIKTGAGTMQLAGNNTYTGNTTVNQGDLQLASSTVNNNISTSPVITVASGAALDVGNFTTSGGFITASGQTLVNNGTVFGNVSDASGSNLNGTGEYKNDVILSGGNFTAGNATTIGTVQIDGNMTVSSGNVTFKFNAASHDVINVTGTATLSNSNIIINPLTPATTGNYVVLTATTLSGLTGGAVVGNFGRVSYTVDSTALASNQLQLDVNGSPATLTWTGADTSTDITAWDNAQTNANWNRTDGGTNGPANKFFDFDNVNFDNSTAQQNVNVNGTVTPASVTFASGNYTVNNGQINSANGVIVNGGNQTITSTLGGASGVTVNGGQVNLNASNSYTGVTTINGGVLTTNQLSNGGSSSGIGASGNAAANLILNGGTLQYTSGSTSIDRLFTLGANGGTISSTAGILTFSNTGTIVQAGTGNRTLTLDSGTTTSGGGVLASIIGNPTTGTTSVSITGNGTWTMSAANSYTGNTTINNGATLKPTGNSSMGPANGGAVVVVAGGTLDLGANPTSNNFNFGLKPFHISGTGNGTAGYGAITNTGISQQNSFQNIILDADASIGSSFGTGSQGRIDDRSSTTSLLLATLDLQGHTLTKVGTSQLSLVGANITQGNIDVQGGLLSLETVTTTNGTGNITFEPNTLSGFFNNSTTTSANTTVGGITWPLIFMGNNTIGSGSGNATIVNAPIVLKGNVTLEPIAGNLPSLTANDQLTLNGSITEVGGSFSVTKLGINVNFLGNSGNNYSGGLFIKQGTISLSGNNALSPNSAVIFGASGTSGTLDLGGFTGTVSGLGTDTNSTASSNIIGSSSTAAASTLIYAGSNANPSTFGGIIQDSVTLVLGPGNVTGNKTVGLQVASGSLDLTAANTYTGNTSVNGGTLIVDSTGSITSNNISTSAGGTFTVVNGGQIPAAANLTNNGITNFNNPTRMINTLNGTTSGATVNLNTTVLTVTTGGSYAGGISGTGGLIVPVGSVLTTGPINANSLEVDGKQTFTNTTIRTLSKVNTLTVAGNTGNWTGALDLTSSRLVVEDSSGTRAADIATYKNMVANNVNGTAGIFSSTAAGNGQVVVVSDNAVRLATFGPAASNFGTGVGNVDANSILITEAVPGDANLDGVVDLKDLQVLAIHWQQPATDWSQTDFDGNGIVALPDLQALAIHWQNGVGSAGQGSGESFSEALAQFSLGGTSSVPEPMSLAILGLGGVVLATRRRKA